MSPRALLAALALLIATPTYAAERLSVVATFSILGDITARVGGDKIELKTLVAPATDAHVYQATTADASAVARARVLIVNGLAFDDWALRLHRAAASSAAIAVASEGVRPIGGDHDSSHGADPHAWQDVRNAIAYAGAIERALTAADPDNASAYQANTAAYRAELQQLNTDIRAALVVIPPARRSAVTTHGSFAYFAAAYGVNVASALGTSTEEQASAKSLARLITNVRQCGIKALFLENAADPRLMRQVARETGVALGGTLYADALSTKDGPAPTYIALMRHNTRLLTEAMAKGH